jgi:hypothetical protein
MNSGPGAKRIRHSRGRHGTRFRAGLDWPGLSFDRGVIRLSGQAPHLDKNLGAGIRIGRRCPACAFFEHGADLIQRRQGQVNQLRADREPPIAHLVEGRLQIVREGGKILEAEHGSRTLDGVQSAEDAAHKLQIAAVAVQLQQRRLQIDQDLAALLAKGILELVGLACHRQPSASLAYLASTGTRNC